MTSQPITAKSYSHPGRVRERNEDSALALVGQAPQNDTALLIVADGMGGYRAGDVASKVAIEAIQNELASIFVPSSAQPTVRLSTRAEGSGERSTVELPETAAFEHYGGFITRAVRRANVEILDYGQNHREARGLGSTVTLALMIKNRAYFANVGDSRSYLFRDGTLRAITRDHSLVARLVEAGEIEQDDVYTHPKRSLIYRSLGADRDDIEVDLFEEELSPGDVLMLCSDGLWEKVRPAEMIDILTNGADMDAIGEQMIALANAHGGEDNITLVMARVGVASESTTDITEVDTGEIETPPQPSGK